MNQEARDIPEELNRLTDDVIGAAIEVHRELGPGLAERVYEEALCLEFGRRRIEYARQIMITVEYKGSVVGEHRLDLLVGGVIAVELKATESVSDQHLAQLVCYLKTGPFPLGLVLNFGSKLMKEGVFRRVNSSCLSSASLRSSTPLRTSSSSHTKTG